MDHKAICFICKKPIGLGTVSADVFQMGITMHSLCLTKQDRARLSNEALRDKLSRMESEIRTASSLDEEQRLTKYGTEGLLLLVRSYFEALTNA